MIETTVCDRQSIPLSNMSLSTKKYEPLLNEGKDELEDLRRSVDYGLQLPMNNRKKDRTIKLLVSLNVALAALLLVLVIVLWREKAGVPAPPYSPAWEAVRYVNRRFEKDDRLYPANETDREVDMIWLNLTGREYYLLLDVIMWEMGPDGMCDSEQRSRQV
jgi:hypothetical protein